MKPKDQMKNKQNQKDSHISSHKTRKINGAGKKDQNFKKQIEFLPAKEQQN